MTEAFEFHAGQSRRRDAFDQYRDLYSVGSTVDLGCGEFNATVRAVRFPRLLFFDRHLAGVTHRRDPRRVSRDGFNHVTLQLVMQGTLLVVTDDVEQTVQAGEVVIFDNTRPQLTSTTGVRLFSFSIARDSVSPSLRSDRIPHGLVLNPIHACELIDHLCALGARAGSLSAKTAEQEALWIGRLIGETLLAANDLVSQSNSALLSGIRNYTRVVSFLDRHVGNSGLTVADIAQGTGVSRSVLYRLFEPVGGVADFVLQMRLRRLRRSLAGSDTKTISTLAAEVGFASANHAVRRFRSAFGVTPHVFRGDQLRARTQQAFSERQLAHVLPNWLEELL